MQIYFMPSDMAGFVQKCEMRFFTQLDNVCRALTDDASTRIIALSGPTCSGKTTTAAKITAALTAKGKEVHLVSIDDFFKERGRIFKLADSAKGVDFDSVNALDLELLASCTESILQGKPTSLPCYDFSTGVRTFRDPVDPDDNDSIFLFEGIQAIYPEVTALLGGSQRLVYISVAEGMLMDDVYFDRRELRLMRRIVRDNLFRSAGAAFTLDIWKSVTDNEDRCILPYENTASLKVNSLLPYEVFLLKPYLCRILATVPSDNPHFDRAERLLSKLSSLPELDKSVLPDNSLLHEFVG